MTNSLWVLPPSHLWVPYTLAIFWENSDMWSIDHNFHLCTKQEEISPLSTKESRNSFNAFLRMLLSLQQRPPPIETLIFPENGPKGNFSSYHNSIHSPASWSWDIYYYWFMKHQTPRKKGIPPPYASTRYPTILQLSSTHMTFKLSY